MKKQLLFLFALCMVAMCYSQTFTASDNNGNTLEFDITSATTVRIIDYISGGTDLDIPTVVTYNSSTYSVTRIDNTALAANNLTSVILPDGLLYIGNYAFEDNQLTNIIIPNGVTFIGEQAFSNNNLTNVVLSNSLDDIDDFAFENNQLTSITIPSNVTDIGYAVFEGNPLSTIISEATTPPTIVTGGVNSDSFNNNRSTINLVIPNATTAAYTIVSGALWTGFKMIFEVTSTTPNEVKVTDYNSASGSNVTIPATVADGSTVYSVTEIGQNAFQSKSLTAITLPNSIVTIGSHAFSGNQITSLSLIPNSVTTIGQQSFQNNQITNIVIPNGVTHIEEAAFANNLLTTIDIADSVTFIGEAAFLGNNITDLNDVVLPVGLTTLPQQFLANNQLTSVTIPNTITSIGERAFQSNLLTNVTIPNSVTSIGDRAFNSNPLSDVYSEAITPPTIITGGGLDTFAADRSTIHLHIPSGTMGVYVTDAGALWTGFNPVTEDASLSINNHEFLNIVRVIQTDGFIKIISSDNIELNNYKLYNISGQKIATDKNTEIKTETLTSGVYILKLNFYNKILTKKIIVN